MTDNSFEECLQLVADRDRLVVLRVLREEGTAELAVDELVACMRSADGISTGNQPTDRRGLAIRLYHNHLPRLDDHGVVDFDAERGTVQYRADGRLEAVLDSVPAEVSPASP